MSDLSLPGTVERAKFTVKQYAAASRAIAAGLLYARDGTPSAARVTITFQPTADTTIDALKAWPDILRAFIDGKRSQDHGPGISILAAPLAAADPTKKHEKLDATLEWASPNNEVAERILDLWQRMMARPWSGGPDEDWKSLIEVLKCAAKEGGQVPDTILPTPYAEAAMAFTFERGRLLLDALSEPGAPLRNGPVSDLSTDVHRPWLGESAPPVQLAYNDTATGAAREPLIIGKRRDWMSPYRVATAAALSGRVSSPIWPLPGAFAEKALGRDGGLQDLIDKIHAAHHHATPAPKPQKECRTGEQLLDTARRRFGALLAHPVLQRLVGFAVDVTIPIGGLKDFASEHGNFFRLSLNDDHRCWTLARLSLDGPGSFLPATETETKAVRTSGLVSNPDAEADELGLINLGIAGQHGPRYDICTVDPALATEGDVTRQKKAVAKQEAQAVRDAGAGQKETATPPAKQTGSTDLSTLRSGGLRVLDRDRLLAACKQLAKEEAARNGAKACLAGEALLLQDAEQLETGKRLLVGVRSADNIEWRSPQFRRVTYHDPAPPAGHENWGEQELERRLGNADGDRRLELDAASLSSLDQVHIEEKIDDDDVDRKVLTLIMDSTVAAWGGEPMGLPPTPPQKDVKIRGREVRTPIIAADELNISRTYAATSAARKNSHLALGSRLRFGWPYYVALCRVVEGGVSITREAASHALKGLPRFSLPSAKLNETPVEGRRFLRHEKVDAPMMLFLDQELQTLKGIKPTQYGTSLVVRSSNQSQRARPRQTSRLLVAPPVPMHFATLHGVFDHLDSATRYPPEGLRGFSRPDLKASHRNTNTPQHVTAISHRPEQPDPELRYYPDPAASLLVLALKRPESDADQGWLGEPLVVAVRAGKTWPDAFPVLIELHAAERGSKNTVRLLDGGMRNSAGSPGIKIVRCMLQPGEDVELQAWFVPTVGQLANWFDNVEAASLLATHGGEPEGPLDSANACARGLKALVGKQVQNDGAAGQSSSVEVAKVCTGAGNMGVPSEARMRQLAIQIHQTMLRRPIAALSTPLSMRLTHAMDETFVPAPAVIPGTLKVTRRRFAGGDSDIDPTRESRLDFIEKIRSQEWDVGYSEEGAAGALFAGRLKFDPVTTSALELEIECAAPDGDLDDENRGRGKDQKLRSLWPDNIKEGDQRLFGFTIGRDHRVTFPKRRVLALRIDGLPLPDDCKAELRQDLLLEGLQSASWGAAKPLGQALRTSLSATLKTTGARLLKVRPVALGRHEGLMPRREADGGKQTGVPGAFEEIWLPSTARPAPPVVDRIQAGFQELAITRIETGPRTFTLRYERTTSYRIWLRRPWASSGEDEKLGVVLWPPGLLSKGVGRDDTGTPIPELALQDGDLGSGGQYVSRWGADPIMKGRAPVGPLLTPAVVQGRGVETIGTAFMPIPVEGPWSSAGQGNTSRQTIVGPETAQNQAPSLPSKASPAEYLAVALCTFSPLFDPSEELWYVDLALKTDPFPMPRMRLGLVRYQPHAREDFEISDGGTPTRLRVSTPVAEWIQPLPGRTVEATCQHSADGKQTKVFVTVKGPFALPDQTADETVASVNPASPFDGTRPALEIELIRHQPGDASKPPSEECAMEIDGTRCIWQTWKPGSAGIATRVDGGWAWTCMFTLPGMLNSDGWRHAISVREITLARSANEETFDMPVESGPRFLARIELA
ncbi:hypothetical protein ACVWYH_009753 [Bradyrhizobium sp. GM24.11]